MRVDELYSTLEDMKKVYPYKDDKTLIKLEHHPNANYQSVVTVTTRDEETDTEITMSKVVESLPEPYVDNKLYVQY